MSKLMGRFRQRNTGAFNYSNPLGVNNLPLGRYWQQAGGLPLYIDPGFPHIYTVPYPPQPDQVHGVVERMSDSTNVGPPFHYGQDMMKVKTTASDSSIQGNGSYHSPALVPDIHGDYTPGSRQSFYEGGFVLQNFSFMGGSHSADFTAGGDFTPGELSKYSTDLSTWGPKAYRTLRPKLEKAGVGQFIGEFRDTPHMLTTSAKGINEIVSAVAGTSGKFHKLWKDGGGNIVKPFMHPKKVADHFINHQFGWVPFLNDLRQISDVYDHSKEYLAQLKRDNAQWIRRVRTLDHTESDEVIGVNSDWVLYPGDENINRITEPGSDGSRCRNTYSTQELTRIWGVGIFKYYRPEFDVSLEGNDSYYTKARQLLTLYGANVSPSLIYKITPWTWLVDWFTNVGDVIDNVSSAGMDSIASKSLSLMRQTVRQVTLKVELYAMPSHVTLQWNRIIETKQRTVGSPYGFGLAKGSLSPKQIAILVALKITH